jgi:hypothetical protein
MHSLSRLLVYSALQLLNSPFENCGFAYNVESAVVTRLQVVVKLGGESVAIKLI